jgi:hypothetical protein
MNRTLFFLTWIGASFVSTVMKQSIVSPEGVVAINMIILVSILTAACFRWQHMGYHPAWGLLTFIPFAPLYGMVMPKDVKTNGIDTFGKVWVGVIIAMVAFVLIMAALGH